MKTHTKKSKIKRGKDVFAAFLKAQEDARDSHRKDFNDLAWHEKQRKGAPLGRIGDIVKFRAGGWGVISKVSGNFGGQVPEYSVQPIAGRPFHPRNKVAWHYEGDMLIEINGPVHLMEKAAE